MACPVTLREAPHGVQSPGCVVDRYSTVDGGHKRTYVGDHLVKIYYSFTKVYVALTFSMSLPLPNVNISTVAVGCCQSELFDNCNR